MTGSPSLHRRHILAAGPAAAAATIGGSALAQTPAASAPPAGKQAPAVYRYKVGDIEVSAIHEGIAARPLDDKFVTNAPFAEVQAELQKLFMPTDKLNITFTPLVVKTSQNLAVIDTGFADNGPPSAGNFYANLAAAGIDPKKVDTVIISHFHGDHISGLKLKDGSDAYPNAKIMVPALEWAFWTDDARASAAPEGMKGAFALVKKNLGGLGDRLVRYEHGKDVIPGIAAVEAIGHTPGHTAFTVTSGNGKLFVTSDITNHPGLFARNPEWSAVFDMDAAKARETRKKILDMVAAERMQIAMYHAPFPATGFIAKQGSGYEYVPAQWLSVL